MNKTAIRNFAVEARRKLIGEISHKAYGIGITKDKILEVETFEGGFRVKGRENGQNFKKYELEQRDKLIQNIKYKGFEQVIEEVAYTWFNRFIALRFMEVNNYLPTGVRVLSSVEEGKIEPDIVKEALNIDLDIDPEIVYRLQDSNDTEDLYKYLLVKQCNQLGKIMPSVFEEIADYTELLLPDKLLVDGSVIRDLVEEIEEYDWKIELNEEEKKEEAEKGEHGIEIIGWLYQYYISEKKDEVFAGLKKNKKITKENIPAATQLFTPKWIVKYMIENSLGRLWLERLVGSDQWVVGRELKSKWKYYLDEAEQELEVEEELKKIRAEYKDMTPEDIKVLDPAMGSGHILVYAFDLLYEIYLSAGYSEREIPSLILEKNLYGLDIDDRAGQLASFALLMKARSKNRRIFRNKPQMNLCSIQESNDLVDSGQWLVASKGKQVDSGQWLVDSLKDLVEYFCGWDLESSLREDFEYLIEVFHDAKEYGSILEVKEIDFKALENRIEEIGSNAPEDIFELQYREIILDKIPPLIQQAKIMSQKYDVVSTNPPYMGRGGMNEILKSYLDPKHGNSNKDLSTVFMECSLDYLKENSFLSMINIPTWMFLSSYENLRKSIIQNNTFINMLHLGRGIFGSDFGTVAFVIGKKYIWNYKGYYKRFFIEHVKVESIEEKERKFYGDTGVYFIQQEKYNKIHGTPIAYWISDSFISVFDTEFKLKKYATIFEGLKTRDNNRFLRLWYEVGDCDFHNWKPYSKGGEFRKWYGNNDYLIKWHNDGKEVKSFKKSSGGNFPYYFKETITWSAVTSYKFSARYIEDSIFGGGGSGVTNIEKIDINYALGLLNTPVINEILNVFGATLNYEVGIIGAIPILSMEKDNDVIVKIVQNNINISKTDWDSFETSWDFKIHPLLVASDQCTVASKSNHSPLTTNHSIKIAFENYKTFTENQFNQLKANEEELNKIFIAIYGLEDELTPEVEDKDITISKADRERDIKSFISYAVGCMFGRYSLDENGLIYAGGEISDKWLVVSGQYFLKEVVYRYVSEELSRVNSMAEVNESSGGSLQNSKDASPGRSLCLVRSDASGGSINSIKHSGGATEKVNQGIHTVSSSSTGFQGGIGNTDFDMYQAEILDAITSGDVSGLVSRGWENAELIDWKTIHYTLITNHYNVVLDNIIPIADGDYFEDDILQRFVEFVGVSFGKESLEENLDYIAETLGRRTNETSRQAIRRYFLRDFYKDHVRIYKKRPIYWLFDSGRQNGFKALIYMHRYNPFTLARVRTDYLHSLQKKYEGEINHLDILIDSEISNREKAAARKNKETILKQIQECRLYDEALAHVANQRIEIDLDDGVKVNYEKFQGIKIPQGDGRKPLKADLLAKI